MPYVLRLIPMTEALGVLAESLDPEATPVYLEWFDVDGRDGLGSETLTFDIAKALRFETTEQALAAWKRQSNVRPIRPDGKPNRPLTAYSAEVHRVP